MKKHLPHLVLSILLFGILSGYDNSKEIPSLYVQHEIKGNNLFIECIVTGISFRESDQTKQKIGKLVVFIDGEKSTEVTSAALIVKGLSQGSHKVKIVVVDLKDEPYGLANEFMVNIPR